MKAIVITGVSSGIGLAAAEYLSKSFYVFGSVRSQADADRLSLQIPQNFEPLIFDVTDENAIITAAKYVTTKLNNQGLYALVNNAGIAVPGPLMNLKSEDYNRQMDINVKGVMMVTNAFLPLLGASLKSKYEPGRIINISSVSGLFNSPFNGMYCVSKHAVESMTEVYRRELIYYGIKVVSIQPGPIKTPIWDKAREIDFSEKFKDSDLTMILDKAQKMIDASEAKAMPVETMAKVINKAITSQNPKLNYLVYPNPWIFKVISKLIPTKMMDKILYKNLSKGGNHRPF